MPTMTSSKFRNILFRINFIGNWAHKTSFCNNICAEIYEIIYCWRKSSRFRVNFNPFKPYLQTRPTRPFTTKIWRKKRQFFWLKWMVKRLNSFNEIKLNLSFKSNLPSQYFIKHGYWTYPQQRKEELNIWKIFHLYIYFWYWLRIGHRFRTSILEVQTTSIQRLLIFWFGENFNFFADFFAMWILENHSSPFLSGISKNNWCFYVFIHMIEVLYTADSVWLQANYEK